MKILTRFSLLGMLPSAVLLYSCGGLGAGVPCSSGFHGVETTGSNGLPLATCALNTSKQVTWSGAWNDASTGQHGTLTLNLSNETGTITFADTNQTVPLAIPLPQGGSFVSSGANSNALPSIGFQYTYQSQMYTNGVRESRYRVK